jgi:amino acid transporter
VISAYDVDEDGGHVDSRVVKLVAVCAISAVCVVLFSLPRFGMFLNKMLAIFKVVLLLAVFSKGMEFANRTDNAFSNDSHSGTSSFIDNMSAFVYVIYSYTGWENANYVSSRALQVLVYWLIFTGSRRDSKFV